MKLSIGQNIEVWDKDWEGLNPLKEIRMWDYFGLRHWITKFVPRNGKVLEAGCGMGRFVFYLSKFGIDIEGVDFSSKIVNELKSWQKHNGFNLRFDVQDVTSLNYKDNELSGYISLGVVEHFVNGPHKPLNEAMRVLKPGGVAIVSTPSYSFNVLFKDIKKYVYNLINPGRGKLDSDTFYQYWYRPGKLKKYLMDSGFFLSRYSGSDLLFAFYELFGYKKSKIDKGTFAYWFSSHFENTILRNLGAQSVTISVKPGNEMQCFICGSSKAGMESLNSYDVPLCNDCKVLDIAKYYTKNSKVIYAGKYIMNPDLIESHTENCDICGCNYMTDNIFENYGFNANVCQECLRKKDINISLSNNNVQPVWRARN